MSHRWTLGFSHSHNASLCLLRDDEIVVAIQEERLNRQKRSWITDLRQSLALRYCLDTAGIQFAHIDTIVCCSSVSSTKISSPVPPGWHGRLLSIPHHLGHAWGAFATSGFADATILIVDGSGSSGAELDTSPQSALHSATMAGQSEANPREFVSIYAASQSGLTLLEKHVGSPHMAIEGCTMAGFASIGAIFANLAEQIFGDLFTAGKVMGLAPLGHPTIPVSDFFRIEDGVFRFRDIVPRRLSGLAPWPENREFFADVAASAQVALEHAILHLANRGLSLNGSRNLAYAGGVALNSVANERIIRETDYADVYVMPAAEDSGPAIGAAYYGFSPQPNKDAVAGWKSIRSGESIVNKTSTAQLQRCRDYDESIPATSSTQRWSASAEVRYSVGSKAEVSWGRGPLDNGASCWIPVGPMAKST